MTNIKQIIQDLILPEFRTLSSEIKRLDEKIDFVREDVRNLREEFKLAIDIHERLGALEAKVGL